MARAISICIVLIFCFLGTLARAAPEKKNLVDSFADSAFILTGQVRSSCQNLRVMSFE